MLVIGTHPLCRLHPTRGLLTQRPEQLRLYKRKYVRTFLPSYYCNCLLMQSTDVSIFPLRADFITAIGNIGGVSGIYASFIIFILDYFVEIDMFIAFIKVMFLEKQTDQEFFNDLFKKEQKKEKKLCCSELCMNILSKKQSSTNIADFMLYSNIRAKENMMVDRGLD